MIQNPLKKLLYMLCVLVCAMINVPATFAQELNEDARFDHAKMLYQKGLYLAARDEFSKVKGQLYIAEATYFIASSAVKAGQDDGEYLVKQFVKDYPSHYYARQAFFELGNYYFQRGAYENALNYYNQSTTDKTQQLSFQKGYCYFKLEQYDEALTAFAPLNKSKNDFAYDAAYFQGYIYYIREQYPDAYKQLKVAFQSDTYKEEALKIYVSALYQLKKYQEIVDIVKQEMPETNDPLIINYLADAHYALKGYRDASENYKKLLSKKAKYRNETNYFKGGYSYYKIDKKEEAIDYLKRAAVEDDTIGAYASYYLGLIYHSQENLPFAVTSFGNTAKYDTRLKEDALYHQSSALLQTENYQEAIEVLSGYNKEFQKGKYKRDVNEMLSVAYSHTSNYDLAMDYIEGLTTLTEPVKKVYQRVTYIRAMSLFNDKQFKAAAETFQKSLVYNADTEMTQQSYYWMAESLSLLKNDKDAVFYYRSVKNTDAELFFKAQYGLGYAYFNLKNYDDALVTLIKVEKLAKSDVNQRYTVDVLMRIADCQFALKNYEKGIKYYQQSLKEGNKNKDQIYFQIGLLYRYLDKDEEAKSYFNKLITEVPNSTKLDHAQFQIAEIDFKEGNEKDAISAYGRLLYNYPNSPFVPYSLLNQAVAYDNLKNGAASMQNFRAILDRFPRHETAKSALLALQTKNANGEFQDFDAVLAKYKAANPNSDALENIEYENARVLFFNQKYDQSIANFNSFLKTYPRSALAVEARYFIGDAYFRTERFSKALEAFHQIENDKDFSKHGRVLYRIAEMESVSGNYKAGNKYYYKLNKGGTTARNQIFLERGLMENYLMLKNYDSVIYYGGKLLSNSRISVVIEASANLSIGKAQYYKKNYEEALIYLLSLVSNSPDETGAEANYFVGKIYYDQAAYDKALQSLFSLTNSFKNYPKWQGNAYILMSDVYLKTDEVFQAKATLNSVIEHSEDAEIVAVAKAKLAEIESSNTNEASQNQ